MDAMIRKLAFALATLLLAGVALAAEPPRPTLRSEATVTGNVVRIGDVIENAGPVANVPIFRAPNLGETGTVQAAEVLAAVRQHALVGLDAGAVSEVIVTRASRAIPARDIEALLAAALARGYALGAPADISFSFDHALRTVQLDPTIIAPPHVERLRYDTRSGRFDASVAIDGAAALRLTGSAAATAEVVTVSRALNRGEILAMGDISLQRIPRAQLTADIVIDPEQAIGRAARGSIAAGRPIRAGELAKQELVQRSAGVTIVYQAPGVTLAVRGKAMEGGAAGDMIDVLNAQSNRTIRGTITGPGQVSVTPVTARVIASADLETVEDLSPARQDRTSAQ